MNIFKFIAICHYKVILDKRPEYNN